MATPSDNDRDDALLRRLYDEPDADGADGELAREVESFQQLRGAVAEYARATEVEPPSRGVDELLAAARQRAPARPAAVVPVAAGGGGLWARLRAWLAPLAAHPALASAAMVIVVAVVGGVLYVKGRGGVTEGSVGGEQAPAETLSQGSATMTTTDKNDHGMVAGLDDTRQTETAPVQTPTPTPTVQQMTPPPEDPAVQKTPPVHSTKPGGTSHGNGTSSKPGKTVATSPGTASANGSGDGEGQSMQENYGGADSVAVGQGAVRTDGAEDDHAAPVLETQVPAISRTPTSSPPPPTAGVVGRDTADEVFIAGEDPTADGGKTKSAEPPKRPTGTDVEQLTRQARTAAKSGDCGVVKSIGGKVKKANATYYKQTFAVDATIKKCL
jgi:hypothetical protein